MSAVLVLTSSSRHRIHDPLSKQEQALPGTRGSASPGCQRWSSGEVSCLVLRAARKATWTTPPQWRKECKRTVLLHVYRFLPDWLPVFMIHHLWDEKQLVRRRTRNIKSVSKTCRLRRTVAWSVVLMLYEAGVGGGVRGGGRVLPDVWRWRVAAVGQPVRWERPAGTRWVKQNWGGGEGVGEARLRERERERGRILGVGWMRGGRRQDIGCINTQCPIKRCTKAALGM